jgi:hypothetical protein
LGGADPDPRSHADAGPHADPAAHAAPDGDAEAGRRHAERRPARAGLHLAHARGGGARDVHPELPPSGTVTSQWDLPHEIVAGAKRPFIAGERLYILVGVGCTGFTYEYVAS